MGLETRISIHAPRAGCDVAALYEYGGCRIFQSTHPVRGATKVKAWPSSADWYFNPRTPCGVRHACSVIPCNHFKFQSTHPVRGATTLPLIF